MLLQDHQFLKLTDHVFVMSSFLSRGKRPEKYAWKKLSIVTHVQWCERVCSNPNHLTKYKVCLSPKPNQVLLCPEPNHVLLLPKPNQVFLTLKPHQKATENCRETENSEWTVCAANRKRSPVSEPKSYTEQSPPRHLASDKVFATVLYLEMVVLEQ